MKLKKCKMIFKRSIICFISVLNISWITPVTVSNEGINISPSIAINNSGNCIVAWTKGNYPDLEVESSFYNGLEWSLPYTISELGINVSPICGIDFLGNVVAVWELINGSERKIMSAQKAAGLEWGSPIMLSTALHNISISMANNANGEFIVCWKNQVDNCIQVSSLEFGNSWSPVAIIADVDNYCGNLKIGIDDAGNGITVFEDSNLGTIFTTQTTGGLNSSWSTPLALTSFGTNTGPVISVTPNGKAVVAWTNIETSVIVVSLYEDGFWGPPIVVSNDYAGYPTVAASANNFFVSWYGLSIGEIKASVNFFGEWELPFNLSSDGLNDYPQSSYCSGNFLTTWTNLMSGDIEVAYYPADNPSASPIIVSSEELNFLPFINSSSTKTAVAWVLMLNANYLIQVNTN